MMNLKDGGKEGERKTCERGERCGWIPVTPFTLRTPSILSKGIKQGRFKQSETKCFRLDPTEVSLLHLEI